jgi:hypothetical protein
MCYIEGGTWNSFFLTNERTPVLSDKPFLLLFYESSYTKLAAVGGGVRAVPASRQLDCCPHGAHSADVIS